MKMRRSIIWLLALALLIPFLRFGMLMWSPQPAVGLTQSGQLQPCPDSPNCIASYEETALGRLEPLRFTDSPEEAMKRLEQLVLEMPRTRIVTLQPGYLHAEYRSWLFRFVDDVEFLIDAESRTIHFRSASRLGYSDLGANRQRMERVRQMWTRPQEK